MHEREMVNRLNFLARGFQHSQILFAGLRANVFALLTEPRTADEVAVARDFSARGARMLLDGLVAIDLVENTGDGRYRNGDVAATCLIPGLELDQTHILRHLSHSYGNFGRLDESLKSGGPVRSERENRSEEELEAFILGMANLTAAAAGAVVEALDLRGRKRMLDVGTGPGSYSIAFLEHCPDLRATLFDLPQVIPIARRQVEARQLLDRCRFIAGDLTQDDFGGRYDFVFLSNIIHSFDSEENQAIVKKCFDTLDPGGTLVVKDFLLDPGRTGPPFSLVFAIHMLLHTPAGDTYTTDEVAAWCRAAGFAGGRFIDLGFASRMWVADKA